MFTCMRLLGVGFSGNKLGVWLGSGFYDSATDLLEWTNIKFSQLVPFMVYGIYVLLLFFNMFVIMINKCIF